MRGLTLPRGVDRALLQALARYALRFFAPFLEDLRLFARAVVDCLLFLRAPARKHLLQVTRDSSGALERCNAHAITLQRFSELVATLITLAAIDGERLGN